MFEKRAQVKISKHSLAMSRQPGFVSVVLVKEHEKESVYQMVIPFQSLETAGAWKVRSL
ncbi:MAG: hypothetical protein ACUVT6_09105 [Thermodesulfobacteriota bacterium]